MKKLTVYKTYDRLPHQNSSFFLGCKGVVYLETFDLKKSLKRFITKHIADVRC